MPRPLSFLFGLFVCVFLVSNGRSDGPIWFDEFDGTSLDFTKWECEVNAFGGGNQEQQLYTDRTANIRVESGKLIIEARRDKIDG